MHVVKIAQNCDSWRVNWSRLTSVDFSFIGPVVQLEGSWKCRNRSTVSIWFPSTTSKEELAEPLDCKKKNNNTANGIFTLMIVDMILTPRWSLFFVCFLFLPVSQWPPGPCLLPPAWWARMPRPSSWARWVSWPRPAPCWPTSSRGRSDGGAARPSAGWAFHFSAVERTSDSWLNLVSNRARFPWNWGFCCNLWISGGEDQGCLRSRWEKFLLQFWGLKSCKFPLRNLDPKCVYEVSGFSFLFFWGGLFFFVLFLLSWVSVVDVVISETEVKRREENTGQCLVAWRQNQGIHPLKSPTRVSFTRTFPTCTAFRMSFKLTLKRHFLGLGGGWIPRDDKSGRPPVQNALYREAVQLGIVAYLNIRSRIVSPWFLQSLSLFRLFW